MRNELLHFLWALESAAWERHLQAQDDASFEAYLRLSGLVARVETRRQARLKLSLRSSGTVQGGR